MAALYLIVQLFQHYLLKFKTFHELIPENFVHAVDRNAVKSEAKLKSLEAEREENSTLIGRLETEFKQVETDAIAVMETFKQAQVGHNRRLLTVSFIVGIHGLLECSAYYQYVVSWERGGGSGS